MSFKNIDLTAYLDHIKADYANWWGEEKSKSDHIQKMIEEFCEDIHFEVGKKYIKVITGSKKTQRSVHSFICMQDDAKFKAGDILKPAGWATPARNAARGNILEGTFQNTRWTGPAYLK